jgi:cytoskeletal protein CcmA (bactofilin family)
MFFKNRNKAQSRIDTLIGVETHIDGNISFSGGLRIDGSVKGDVTETSAPGTLVLSETGRIEGAIKVSRIVVNGKVTGPVHSAQFIELQSKARVVGDVYYQSLEMHTGALIEGRLVYIGEPQQAATELIA